MLPYHRGVKSARGASPAPRLSHAFLLSDAARLGDVLILSRRVYDSGDVL